MNELLKNKINRFPPTRFMGSKRKLINFIYSNIRDLQFDTVLDAFGGSGVVSFLFKNMGKEVRTNDFLKFSYMISKATIENNKVILNRQDIASLLVKNKDSNEFVSRNFKGLYFSDADNLFIDQTYANIKTLNDPYKRALALSALARACIKKRPRGIFTFTGMRYNDGRRDLRISFKEQFLKSIESFNRCVFDNGRENKAFNVDIFDLPTNSYDLVYIDPPYCSIHSDNDYSRRYHFVEGLMSNWNHVSINESTKTKKFDRILSAFDSKRTIYDAFERLFGKFKNSILVVSYSSNSVPTLSEMTSILKKYKSNVKVVEFNHKYSFGTQKSNIKNNMVKEYLFIGTD